jgi:creatinine amidohydrolase
LLALLEDVCGSIVAHGFTKIAIVSSHATNKPFGQILVREFAARHRVVIVYAHYIDFCREVFSEGRTSALGGEMHGGELETSVQLHLRPALVRMDLATSHLVDAKRHFGISTAGRDLADAGNIALGYDIGKLFPSGVMGDAAVATSELGAKIFEAAINGLAGALDEYRNWNYGDTASPAPSSWLDPETWHNGG